MPLSDELRDLLGQISGQVPVWLDIAVALAGVWGLFLWLFGRRIIKPSLAMSGLIVGAVIGALIGRDLGGAQKIALAMIVGGVVGAVIVWITYRVWVALLLAVVLGVAAPWAVLAWHGQSGPEIKQVIKEEAKGVGEKGAEVLAAEQNNDDSDHAARKELFDRMVEAGKRLTGELRDWWGQLNAGLRWSATAGAVLMAAGGLMLGLLLPELAASLVASINGSLLLMVAVLRLGVRYTPSLSGWLPDSPRRLLIALVVMAAVGALIQWTILRRKADQ